MVTFGPDKRQEQFFSYVTSRKRGRKKVGWVCGYDRNDPLFIRFINRFNDEGNLTIGPERYWRKGAAYVSVEGTDWRLPKFDTGIVPGKSKITSQPKDNTDYVYLIRMGRTKFYKIGKSNDPKGRLASMQTASPYKLTIVHVFKADNAAAAEEALHHKLHQFRQAGEWFKMTDEQQKTICSVTAYEVGHFIVGAEKRGIEVLFPEQGS